ncbi:MAG: YfiR family protein [Bordetella sp.]|uniref:YfiR family protein n=1 Tax=Bordetella sp. TaxID=28081 RepID=UPI003F7C22F9
MPATCAGLALRGALSVLLALSCATAVAQSSATGSHGSRRVQDIARIVGGIINFTQWPGPPRKVRLCIATPAVYADLLVRDIEVSTPLASVQYLAAQDTRLDSDCDAVYIEQTGEAGRADLFRRLAGRPVLSITGSGDGCVMGSLFCISNTGAQATFSVNLDAIARSGLHINPKVLLLVHKQPDQ